MPRGVHLSDKSKEQIYTSFTLGESPDDIAVSMDLNPGTVRRIVREQRKLHERKREEMSFAHRRTAVRQVVRRA